MKNSLLRFRKSALSVPNESILPRKNTYKYFNMPRINTSYKYFNIKMYSF